MQSLSLILGWVSHLVIRVENAGDRQYISIATKLSRRTVLRFISHLQLAGGYPRYVLASGGYENGLFRILWHDISHRCWASRVPRWISHDHRDLVKLQFARAVKNLLGTAGMQNLPYKQVLGWVSYLMIDETVPETVSLAIHLQLDPDHPRYSQLGHRIRGR
jgi:hypothetical protein